jgi:hypothetical protein
MKDAYQFWPIRAKRNIALLGRRKGHLYWRVGMGSRWEAKRDGSRRILGWSFFIGPSRLIFGKTTK